MSNEMFVRRVCLSPRIMKVQGVYTITAQCYADDHSGNLRLTTFTSSAKELSDCWRGLVEQLGRARRNGVIINFDNFTEKTYGQA